MVFEDHRGGPGGRGYLSEWQELIWGMSKDERRQYAAAAGTSLNYLEGYLSSARKVPGRNLLQRLQDADERVTREMLLDHFYPGDQTTWKSN